jgi:hypothetical protein
MPKYRVRVSYRWDYEVEADTAFIASEMVEQIMLEQEECGDLGAPDGIDEDIEKLED